MVGFDACQSPQRNECSSDLVSSSARDACKDMYKKASTATKIATDMAEVTDPLVAFQKIFSSAKSTQDMLNKSKLNINTTALLKQTAICKNQSDADQSNVIDIDASSDCPLLSPHGVRPSIYLNKIKMENIDESHQSCHVNQAIKALSKMKASIDSQALLQSLNKAKGFGSSSSTHQKVCNDLSTTESACKYVHQMQCCANNAHATQENLLKLHPGCDSVDATNLLYENTAQMFQQCTIASQSAVSSKQATKIKNTVTLKAKNTSTGMTLGALAGLILACAVAFAIVVGSSTAAVAYGMMSTLFGSIILLLLGLGFIGGGAYLIAVKSKSHPGHTFKNCPLFLAPTAVTHGEMKRMTYGDAKKYLESTAGVTAMDYIPDPGSDRTMPGFMAGIELDAKSPSSTKTDDANDDLDLDLDLEHSCRAKCEADPLCRGARWNKTKTKKTKTKGDGKGECDLLSEIGGLHSAPGSSSPPQSPDAWSHYTRFSLDNMEPTQTGSVIFFAGKIPAKSSLDCKKIQQQLKTPTLTVVKGKPEEKVWFYVGIILITVGIVLCLTAAWRMMRSGSGEKGEGSKKTE